MANKTTVFEISSFRGGLSDWEDKGIAGSFKFGSNIDIRKQKDSLSCGQALVDEGLESSASPSASISPSSSVSRSPSPSLSPSPSPSTGESPSPSATPSASVSLSPSATPSSSESPSPSPTAGLTTVFEDLIRWFVKCSDGYTYGFGNTGCIYRRDADGVWMRVYKDTNGEIKGAEEKPSSNGKTYLYWATNRILMRKEIPGLSNWNDAEVVNSDLESTDWHTMKQIGGALYIANKEFLSMVGYDDSFTPEALDIVPGNIVKTLVERNGRIITGTYKAADPNKGINAAIDCEYPLAQVGDDGEIFYSNMSDSIPVKRFPGGGKCNPGGVINEKEEINFFEWDGFSSTWVDKQSVGNMSLWGVYDAESGKGGIYSFGRKRKDHPFVLNLEYQLDVDEIGALVNVDGITLASYRDGSNYGVKAVDPTTKAIGIYEGLDLKAPVKKPVNTTIWTYAEIFMSPLPADCSVSFYYRVNKTGDFVLAKTASGENSFSTFNGNKAVFLIQAEGEIFEPRIVMTPSDNNSPEIHRIRIFFN